MSEWRIPLFELDYGPEETQAALRVLENRWLSMGPETADFERQFAQMLGIEHAFAVSSGTAALHLAYLLLELKSGDEIVQPAVNFVAAANMTLAAGAKPVFADILSLEEPTIDPGQVERLMTPRTRAVVVMHYGGYLCRMAELAEICRKRSVALIEDACHAVGARYKDAEGRVPHGRMAGTLGDAGCFSFYSNKNLSTGEGGMIVTARKDWGERIRLLRSHGITTPTWDRHLGHAYSYDVALHGYNYRLDDLRSALGKVQLKKLAENNRRRRELVSLYRKAFSGQKEWRAAFERTEGESACHLFTALAPSAESRRRAVERLKAAGIQSSLHYPCIADFDSFREYAVSPLERSRAYCSRTITLPLYPAMTAEQVEEVCGVLFEAGL